MQHGKEVVSDCLSWVNFDTGGIVPRSSRDVVHRTKSATEAQFSDGDVSGQSGVTKGVGMRSRFAYFHTIMMDLGN